jgi:hypothetical protein
MSLMKTSNDSAWEKIFSALDILAELDRKPSFLISAADIKAIGQREPRLMAKFDTKESLPQLFRREELNINAVSNGHYVIFRDPGLRSFIPLDYSGAVPVKVRPEPGLELDTLSFSSSLSESNAIDFAHHSGILSGYSGEEELRLTSRGRFFSEAFSFRLGAVGMLDVKGVQIEVDAGYEGMRQFLIIEAKSSKRSSFNMRQLYYPYAHFIKKTRKQVRTVLLSFSNGIYYFTEIAFTPGLYEYRIVDTKAFEVLVEEPPRRASAAELLSQSTFAQQGIPVPQADDLDRVIDLVLFLENPSSKFAIAAHFELDERQGDYYGNAAAYIGLVTKKQGVFCRTVAGDKLASIRNRAARNLEVIRAVLRTELFNDLVRLYYQQGKSLSDASIVERLQREGLTGTTPARRKSTVRSWLSWISANLNE